MEARPRPGLLGPGRRAHRPRRVGCYEPGQVPEMSYYPRFPDWAKAATQAGPRRRRLLYQLLLRRGHPARRAALPGCVSRRGDVGHRDPRLEERAGQRQQLRGPRLPPRGFTPIVRGTTAGARWIWTIPTPRRSPRGASSAEVMPGPGLDASREIWRGEGGTGVTVRRSASAPASRRARGLRSGIRLSVGDIGDQPPAVRIIPAIDTACSSAERITLAGSTTPLTTRSSYSTREHVVAETRIAELPLAGRPGRRPPTRQGQAFSASRAQGRLERAAERERAGRLVASEARAPLGCRPRRAGRCPHPGRRLPRGRPSSRRARPPPGAASSISSTSVAAPTLTTPTPPDSPASRSWSFSRSRSEPVGRRHCTLICPIRCSIRSLGP